MSASPESFDLEVDCLIAGSGAGGLACAVTAAQLGLEVLVLEKEDVFGGTTARSGGVLWIPGNPVNPGQAETSSRDAAREYLRRECGPLFDAPRVEAFLQAGPRMVSFFERETRLRFQPLPDFPDYHPRQAGASVGGRSITCEPFDARDLGDMMRHLRQPLKEITFVGMMFNASAEVAHFFNATRSLRSAWYVARRLVRHTAEMARYGRATRLTNGNALAARLLRSALDLKVTLWRQSPVMELLSEEGRVIGARVAREGRMLRVRARRGVVLATGGFPQDTERRKALFRHAARGHEHLSPAPAGNTGDGLRLGQAAGGEIASELPHAAAWIPVSSLRWRDGARGVFPHLIDRYKPGVIAVTRDGRRFVNESDSYHDFGTALLKACEGQAETAAFLLCDHRTLRRYGMGHVKPFPIPIGWHLRSGYLLRGGTLAALAEAAGIDAEALARTVSRFNKDAGRGEDTEFGRGSTAYNRYLGDATHRPNPCVAPLAAGPFYAIKVFMGDLGTFAGLRTDGNARVLDGSGQPIEGLYAAGNDSCSIMGGNYPGAGITLGPAMTFGFLAAEAMFNGPGTHAPTMHTKET